MKFTAVLATAACAIASVSAYSNETCPSSEILLLLPLASNPNLQPCQDASGWKMVPPSGYPTAEQNAIMCATSECFDLIEAVKAIPPTDCLLTLGNVKLNVLKMVEEFEPSCFS